MSDLMELYQETILDHGRRPRNFGEVDPCTHKAEGYNPLCGDHFHLTVDVVDGTIRKAGFTESGCAISTASASLMTLAVKGKPVADALKLFEGFHEMVTADAGREVDSSQLGKLAVFAGVREFPMRVKCATLAWHTLQAALERDGSSVTTE